MAGQPRPATRRTPIGGQAMVHSPWQPCAVCVDGDARRRVVPLARHLNRVERLGGVFDRREWLALRFRRRAVPLRAARVPAKIVTVHRGLSQFSRRGRHCVKKRASSPRKWDCPLRRRKGTVPCFRSSHTRMAELLGEKRDSPRPPRERLPKIEQRSRPIPTDLRRPFSFSQSRYAQTTSSTVAALVANSLCCRDSLRCFSANRW